MGILSLITASHLVVSSRAKESCEWAQNFWPSITGLIGHTVCALFTDKAFLSRRETDLADK